MTSHGKRILTALLLLALLGVIFFIQGHAVAGVVAVVSGLGQWEFYSLFWPGNDCMRLKIFGTLGGTALVLTAHFGGPWPMLLLLLAMFWLFQLQFLFSYSRRREAADHHQAQILTTGLLYVPAVLSLFLFLAPVEAALVLLATFATDTGAYYSGSIWGNRRIWPVISPKKTWMGSLGGLVLCVTVSTIYGLTFGQAHWWTWCILGVLLNCAAQIGDFFESALKRWLNVKDSGRILPGHGGILDRIDSLLLVVLVYAGLRAIYRFF